MIENFIYVQLSKDVPNKPLQTGLSLYHTILTFNNPEKQAFWKLREKEKMLVTSIFFFSHNFFYLSQNKFKISVSFILSSVHAYNLDQSKIL